MPTIRQALSTPMLLQLVTELVCLVALTGYGQAADRAATAEAGFDVHLVKPVHAEQLLELLRGGIRRPEDPAPAADVVAPR